MIGQLQDSNIRLKRIFIESKLPDELSSLYELANNLWWSWNKEAIEIFEYIGGDQWIPSRYNPIVILDTLSQQRAKELIAEKDFMKKLKRVYTDFQKYTSAKPAKDAAQIAYFSMEYGLHISVRLYSGGLGVLAGDFLKEASDRNVNMSAVGLLYRYGYFQQSISMHGDQINNFPAQQFTKLPISPVKQANGEWLRIYVDLQGRRVTAKVWEMKVGRISLYLLDTDLDENDWNDRTLTHQLYGGDNEHRLKQEILLGTGGIKALEAIGVQADIYHCNEGHAAFMGVERLKTYIQQENMNFAEALEVVRATSLFTTHTPVPAGHDYFHESLLRSYLFHYAGELGIDWEQFVALGKIDPSNHNELFSMSHLAIRLSQEVNGVSKLHGEVSQKMFNVLYPGFHSGELHIGYVTNSVHYPTWISNECHELYQDTFGKKFIEEQSNKKHWHKIFDVADDKIMDIRQQLKKKLLDYVRTSIEHDMTQRGENPRAIFEMINKINDKALVVGFARRFATYKRAHLLFSNLDRLSKLVNDEEKPVIFIFSGKAHPADQGGQALIKRIVEISKRPEFTGKIIFMENYNMEMAKFLVQGVDIWLNTPTRPKEASGTSGMKAALNGVMNFSVLDGWWAEGYRPDAGWSLKKERTYENQDLQNELDAETLYNTFETDIVPTYFDRNDANVPERWVQMTKTLIAEVAPTFTMTRMMEHYFERFYDKLKERGRKVRSNNYKMAKELVGWKNQVKRNWEDVRLIELDMHDTINHPLPAGAPFQAKLRIDTGNIPVEFLGMEVVFFNRISDQELELKIKEPLKMEKTEGSQAVFSCSIDPEMTGVYEFGFRVFPRHNELPHQQDLALVKWFI
ncbi:MAG: alpha-glucan family phosphorylase [Saprospiraceae bacterium]|nr:alpha-glucan family phosphorylase [Saprospiraceae bacterium]